MDELSRLRGSEGGIWNWRGRKAGETAGAFLHQPSHNCPQCGQFQGLKMALF